MFGVCYYPEHWPKAMWQQDAQEMKALGIDWVRIGDFSWSRIEPTEGQYSFEWMDEAINTFNDVGLKVIICTPTATPPKWLIDKHSCILPVDVKTGLVRGFGSRRHYDFSCDEYLEASLKITKVMAERYGSSNKVHGWQTDNELGCHDTTQSASQHAKEKFQLWLKNKYQTIETLNKAWGTVFWSMEYNDFSQIELPLFGVTEMALSHQLDYRRFSSDQVLQFHDKMIDVLKAHTKNQFITHNMIPMPDTQIDNFALTERLDFVSYDSYPIGRTAEVLKLTSRDYLRTGHPDLNAYFLEQVRGLSKNEPYWVMEQQPGVVNWAHYNPMPAKGMVRLWVWEAFAHGAECVSFFRWRQLPFGQEQMHAGIKTPNNEASIFYNEIKSTIAEFTQFNGLNKLPVKNKVAIVTGTENQWFTEIETQSTVYKHTLVEFQYYSVLQQLGINVDFISQNQDFDGYDLVICPATIAPSHAFYERVKASQAHFIFGPRFASKTKDLHIPDNLAPGYFRDLLGYKVLTADTMPAEHDETIHYLGQSYKSKIWCDVIELDEDSPLHVTAQIDELNTPALLEGDRFSVITTLSDDAFLKAVIKNIIESLAIDVLPLNEGVRYKRRGDYLFILNYSNQDFTVTDLTLGEPILGERIIKKHDLAIYNLGEASNV